MGSTTHICTSDYRKEDWSLAGSGVTRLFEAWNNDDDTKYAACPSYKGRAAVKFPVDISSVPDGAVITSVTVYVRAAKTDSNSRAITVNLLCDDLTSQYTSKTIYLTTTPTTYEVGTYTRDPLGFEWDLERINKLIAQVFCFGSNLLAAIIRCYKLHCVINYRVRPTVTVTAPTGTVKTPSPTVAWTYTQADGDPQAKADYKVYTAAAVTKPTFNPDVTPALFSKTVIGDQTSLTLPTALDPGDYYVYVRAYSSFGAKSLWSKIAFTVQGPSPGSPTILCTPDNSTSSVTLTLQDTSNLLSVQQADAETLTDKDEYVPTNCTIARNTSTFFNVGSASYALTAASAATMSVESTPIEVGPNMPITARAQFLAATTGRTCNIKVVYYDGSHNVVGSTLTGTISDVSGTWLEASATGTTPANTAYARITLEVVSPALSEVHYVDAVGLMYGTNSAWNHGGHVSRNILSSDYACHPGYASWTPPSGGTTLSNRTTGNTQPGNHGPNSLRLTGAVIAPTISFVAAGTVFSATTSGSAFTLNKPAGVTTGDLMIAFVTTSDYSTSCTPPAGWTLVNTSTVDDASSDTTMHVLIRTAGGSEPASWTDGLLNVASARRTAVVVAYRGADDAANQFLAQNVSSTAADTPLYLKTATLNNTNANAWRISAFAFNDAAASGTVTANQVDPATGISFVGAANAWTSTSSGTSYTINRPNGLVSGDLLIAAVSCTGTATFTAPSGWTVVRQTTAAGSPNTTLCILKKTATGSEPTSWSGTINTSVRAKVTQCVAYRQADTAANQFIVENAATSGSGGQTINTPTVNNTNSASWRISIFAANDNDGRSWSTNETVERADAEASWSEWFGGSEGQTLSIADSNGTVGVGNHSRSGTLSSAWDSAVSWIGIIKVLGTPPAPVANETERVDTTIGGANPYITTAIYDSNGVVPVGNTNVTGTFAPGSGSDITSAASWIGLIVPPNPITSGTVLATMTNYTDISKISPDVLKMADNKITFSAAFIGSTPGTPYLKMYFYRGNALIGTDIAEGNGFTTTEWTKSSVTFTLPSGTTRVKGEVQITNRNAGDTVDVDMLSIALGSSDTWRAGTSRPTHPIWNVPIIEYADDDGTGYTEWKPLLGLELNRPTYDDFLGQLTYVDHTLVPLTTRKYRAQTLSYGLTGDQFVSEWGPESSGITVVGTHWWLKNIADPTQNLSLPVSAETVSVELNNTANVFQPLGEDFPVVISEGYKADQFSLKLVLDRAAWVKLKKILAAGKTLFLQSDTDMAWWVRSIGNLSAGTIVSWNRQTDPIRIVDIEFVEVKPEV